MLHIITKTNEINFNPLFINRRKENPSISVCIHTIHPQPEENLEIKRIIESIDKDDVICYINEQTDRLVVNESANILLEKFKKENVDLFLSAQMNAPPTHQTPNHHPNQTPTPPKTQHPYVSPLGYIGYQHAIIQYYCRHNRKDTAEIAEIAEKETIRIKLDTNATIFMNMHLIPWSDIWIQQGQIYNRILEETPCFVHFNLGSWKTERQENILPVLLKKIEKSQHVHLPLCLSQYKPSYLPKTQRTQPFQHTEETRRILSKIDGIIYINLDKRTDRRQEIEDEFTRYGIQAERFSAIETPGKGIVGCTYSHLAVYKLAKERGYKNVLILEDDFVFMVTKDVFYQNLQELLDSEVDYQLCMLAYNNTQSPKPTQYPFLMKTVEAQTASAYLVHHTFYDRIIELFEWAAPLLEETNEHWKYANDQVWKRLQKEPDVNWFCFKERIGKQQDGYSDNSEKFMELIEH